MPDIGVDEGSQWLTKHSNCITGFSIWEFFINVKYPNKY